MPLNMLLFLEQNFVRGLPLVNYPNVCTNSPRHGQAFCVEHVKFLNEKYPNVPTDIRGFLKYCGIERSSTGTYMFVVPIILYYSTCIALS